MSLKIVLVLSTLYFSDEIVWLIIIENKILEMPCTHKQKQTNKQKQNNQHIKHYWSKKTAFRFLIFLCTLYLQNHLHCKQIIEKFNYCYFRL